MSQTKFVIYHEARTGSTMLQTLLDNHPDVFCEFEIFHHINEWNNYSKYKIAREYLYDRVINPAIDKKATGFKLQHYQAKSDIMSWMNFDVAHELTDVRDVLAEDNYKIMRPYRYNKLEQFVSMKVAFKTNFWLFYNSRKTTPNTKIKFNADEFLKWYESVPEGVDRELDDVPFCQLERLDVPYEGMVDDYTNTTREIFDFLGVEYAEVSPRTHKGRRGTLKDWLKNYEEAVTFYDEFRKSKPEPRGCIQRNKKGR